MKRTLAAAGAVLALATACREPVIERVPGATFTPTVLPPTGTPSPPKLKAEGPSPSCVNGWREPAYGSELRSFPLDLMKTLQGLDKDFFAVDLRYFTGPDDADLAPASKQKTPVERWYAHVVYTGKPDFLIRYLVVRRKTGSAIVAIADYSTTGFSSPHWYGFDGNTGKNTYPGLPGTWPGKPFDYAQSGKLPAEVRGCLT